MTRTMNTPKALETAAAQHGWSEGERIPGFRLWNLRWRKGNCTIDVEFTRRDAINSASWWVAKADGGFAHGGYAKGTGRRGQVLAWFEQH